MFSNSKNVELICQLIKDIREYGTLRLERFELDMVSKLALAVGMLAMGTVVAVLMLVALTFVSLAVAYMLAPHVGGAAIAMLIVGLSYIALALIVYLKRQTWIVTPLTLFLHDLFMDNKK